MSKAVLVNPSMATLGYSMMTPRWLFVIAQARPQDLVGGPVVVDETIKEFDPAIVSPGDSVGISISTGNCTAGYRVLKEAKRRGATVIMGGIHATIFPESRWKWARMRWSPVIAIWFGARRSKTLCMAVSNDSTPDTAWPPTVSARRKWGPSTPFPTRSCPNPS